MKLIQKLSLTSALCLAAVSATAQDFDGTSVGFGVSTLGGTIEVATPVAPNIDVRGIGMIPLSFTERDIEVDDDYTLDADAKIGGGALLVDYYFNSGIRLSGGVFINNTSVDGQFNGPNPFMGSLNFDNEVAAMVTGGYRYNFNNGVYVGGELGAIFTGINVTTNSADPQVQSDVSDMNDTLDDLPALPYIGFTVGYEF